MLIWFYNHYRTHVFANTVSSNLTNTIRSYTLHSAKSNFAVAKLPICSDGIGMREKNTWIQCRYRVWSSSVTTFYSNCLSFITVGTWILKLNSENWSKFANIFSIFVVPDSPQLDSALSGIALSWLFVISLHQVVHIIESITLHYSILAAPWVRGFFCLCTVFDNYMAMWGF